MVTIKAGIKPKTTKRLIILDDHMYILYAKRLHDTTICFFFPIFAAVSKQAQK